MKIKIVKLILLSIFIQISQADQCLPSQTWPYILKFVQNLLQRENMTRSQMIIYTEASQKIPLNKIPNNLTNPCMRGYVLQINPCLDPPAYIENERCNDDNCLREISAMIFQETIVVEETFPKFIYQRPQIMTVTRYCSNR